MSYEIIPNWTYLGKPVYTNTKDNTLLDMPVNIPVAIPVATTYSSNYNLDILPNRNLSRRKELHHIKLDDSLHFKSVYPKNSYKGEKPNYNEMDQIIKTKTMYRRKAMGDGYEMLGNYVRHLTTADGDTRYYFSEDPTFSYHMMELYYDPSETNELSNKKAGTRKTRKNRKRK